MENENEKQMENIQQNDNNKRITKKWKTKEIKRESEKMARNEGVRRIKKKNTHINHCIRIGHHGNKQVQ